MNRKEAKRKSRQNSLGGGRCPRVVQKRRMTCPSPHEISQVLQSSYSEGKLTRGVQFVHMTLMMHSWVVSSHTFAHKLLSLYPPHNVPFSPSTHSDCKGHWVGQFPEAFEADPLLEQEMGDLWSLVGPEGGENHCQLIDSSYLNPPTNPSHMPSPTVKKRKVSLLFDHMEPDQMAQHLSYLEFKNFCRVSHLDYHSYVVRGSVRDNPALERSVMMCNGVSQWVQLMILSRHTAQQRAQVFTKFIHVAQKKLRSLQNFNTLMAVIGGLCHSSISRLKDTASLLPQDVTKMLSELRELLSSRSNYSTYRRVYSECTGFKVPILGVHLKDLISLNEALPDYLEDDKINLGKLQHLYSNITELLSIHKCTPPFEANKDLLHLLTTFDLCPGLHHQLSLDLYYTEDEIYDLSYAKEPRNPKIQPTVPVKPPVVAEWGSGVTPRLDPDTISTHVKQMSIMKNYDLNLDGYISLEDFENIASNFPFSFCTHHSDREGEISHEEITSYFMRGMSICAKLGLNFLHNFHETTYKRPTFCDTCGGFVSTQYWANINKGAEQTEPKSTQQADVDVGSQLSDRSTQTEPGVWTPEPVERRGNHTNSLIPRSPPEKEKAVLCTPPLGGQERQLETGELQDTQDPSMSEPSLEEKMVKLQLHKEKRKEPG
ncbi:hypothetical protein JZ751_002105 [Albula glossodonta]|uniref:RAS guanyl releasing protein 4 n=1 Tax=Albula glossodonta TaxID=121402 RepID=A0A8T2P8X9_9TELE|nr:hypothetical protein JZ751_002105 [Albula glossodonta]